MSNFDLTLNPQPYAAEFVYQRLPDPRNMIRLFTIHSGVEGGPQEQALLCCSITQYNLSDAPEYVALSYVWGNPLRRHKILLNGCAFYVTNNLAAALLHFQEYPNIRQRMWIDAICIDQGHNEEKEQQIPQLRSIFQQATFVIAWIGLGTGESDMIIRKLNDLGERVLSIGPWEVLGYERSEEAPLVSEVRREIKDNILPLSLVANIYNRPFWNRVWILQELAVSQATIFFCGHQTIIWGLFNASLTVMMKFTIPDEGGSETEYEWVRRHRPNPFPMIMSVVKYGASNQRCSLRELLDAVPGTLKATDARDMIFALLDLSADAYDLGITVDYSLDNVRLYVKVGCALLQQHGLSMLSSAEGDGPRMDHLPSWVPDWTTLGIGQLSRLSSLRQFLASGSSNSDFSIDKNINVMKVLGAQIGVVQGIGTVWDEDRVAQFPLEELKSWFAELDVLVDQYATMYSVLEKHIAKWQTPVALRPVPSNSAQETKTHKSYQYLRGFIRTPSDDAENGQLYYGGSYLRAMNYNTHHRRAFITSPGYIGLGSQNTQVGDLVCILLGAKVPFIIRKLDQGYYTLVGDAYVFGIMGGEFIETNPRCDWFQLK